MSYLSWDFQLNNLHTLTVPVAESEGAEPGLSFAIIENMLYLESVDELYALFSVILPLSLARENFEFEASVIWYATVPNIPESLSVALLKENIATLTIVFYINI